MNTHMKSTTFMGLRADVLVSILFLFLFLLLFCCCFVVVLLLFCCCFVVVVVIVVIFFAFVAAAATGVGYVKFMVCLYIQLSLKENNEAAFRV